jgi:hypothetical protein
MQVNVEKIVWTKAINKKEVALDLVDCYLLMALYEPVVQLDGLTFVPATTIIEDAKIRFAGMDNVEEAVERAKEQLVNDDLIAVKESSSGVVNVALTKEGLPFAKALDKHIQKYVPILRLCNRNDNPITDGIEWMVGQ